MCFITHTNSLRIKKAKNIFCTIPNTSKLSLISRKKWNINVNKTTDVSKALLNTIAWEIIIYFRFDESGEHEHTREKLQSLTCKPHGNILSLPHLLKAQMHILLYVQWKYFPKALLITRNIEITELNALKQGCHCISSANLLFYLSCYSLRTGLRDFSQG